MAATTRRSGPPPPRRGGGATPPPPAAVVAVVADGAPDGSAPIPLDVSVLSGSSDGAWTPPAPATRDIGSAAPLAPTLAPTASAASSPSTLHVTVDAAALAAACPAWRDALAAAAPAARGGGGDSDTASPAFTLRVPARLVTAAVAVLRVVHDARDVVGGADGAEQLLLLDMLRLADAWGVTPVLAIAAAALAAVPPHTLGWAATAAAAALAAAGRAGVDSDALYAAVQRKILHAAATDPASIPPYLGLDIDVTLDNPALAAAWSALPLAGAAALLSAPATAVTCQNSAAAAAAAWLAAATPAGPPDAKAVLGAALRPEHCSPLFAAALAGAAPWVAAPPGAPPREARPPRPPSRATRLAFEYNVEASAVAALVARGGGGGNDAGASTTPLRATPPPPSRTRFWGGLHWYVAVDTCQADARQAGLFLHAALPGAGGRGRPPLGAAYTIRQASASAAVAPVKLDTASVWPATTAYGLAGVRGVPTGVAGEEDGGGWAKSGRLRFHVAVTRVL